MFTKPLRRSLFGFVYGGCSTKVEVVWWPLWLGYLRGRGGRCAGAGKRRVDQVDQIEATAER
jgi:hypothetical protein